MCYAILVLEVHLINFSVLRLESNSLVASLCPCWILHAETATIANFWLSTAFLYHSHLQYFPDRSINTANPVCHHSAVCQRCRKNSFFFNLNILQPWMLSAKHCQANLQIHLLFLWYASARPFVVWSLSGNGPQVWPLARAKWYKAMDPAWCTVLTLLARISKVPDSYTSQILHSQIFDSQNMCSSMFTKRHSI